jgi:hypothetical protein
MCAPGSIDHVGPQSNETNIAGRCLDNVTQLDNGGDVGCGVPVAAAVMPSGQQQSCGCESDREWSGCQCMLVDHCIGSSSSVNSALPSEQLWRAGCLPLTCHRTPGARARGGLVLSSILWFNLCGGEGDLAYCWQVLVVGGWCDVRCGGIVPCISLS